MPSSAMWIRATVAGVAVMVGGPIFTFWLVPSEEELFKKYNPDLQRRSLEGREERLKEANDFIDRLKEYSKSDKPVWTVWKEESMRKQREQRQAEADQRAQKKSIAEEIRRQRLQGESE